MPKIVVPSPSVRGRIRNSVAAGIALAAAATAYLACQHEAPPPTPAPAATQTAPPIQAKPADNDPAKLFQDKAAPVAVKYTLPELAFEEHSEGLPTSGTWRGYPLLQDFTGDKRADLVCSNREEDGYSTWESTGTGAWIHRIEGLPRDMQYGPARAADVNSDGIPDLLLSAHGDALRVYLNDGKMKWKRSEAVIQNPHLMLDIATGNLNGDGFADIVGIGHFEGGIGVYLGDGKGGFERLPESGTVMGTKAFGIEIQLADIDGDGLDDIVAATNEGLKVLLTRAGSPMHWEDVSAGLPKPKIGNSITAAKVGRFRTGGWPQIASCLLPDPGLKDDERDAIGVYAWNPEKKVWEHIDHGLPRGEKYRDLAPVDLNKDGNLDLVVMSIDSGAAIYLSDGQGGFKAKGRLAGAHGKGRIAIGDIDGDGWPDIALAIPAEKEHPEGGGLRAFLNRPAIWK